MRTGKAIGWLAMLTTASAALADGSGLSGAYYAFSSIPGSIANAESLIASAGSPTATFTATSVCFPSCGNTIGDSGSTIADFLGSSGTNISSNSVSALDDHVVLLTGYLYAPTAGTYSFTLGSDDGSALWINNSLVISNDGDHPYTAITNNITLNAGLNQIQVLQFEDSGVTGLTLLENGNALSTAQLYPPSAVPLPATAWLLVSALFPVALLGRRRRLT